MTELRRESISAYASGGNAQLGYRSKLGPTPAQTWHHSAHEPLEVRSLFGASSEHFEGPFRAPDAAGRHGSCKRSPTRPRNAHRRADFGELSAFQVWKPKAVAMRLFAWSLWGNAYLMRDLHPRASLLDRWGLLSSLSSFILPTLSPLESSLLLPLLSPPHHHTPMRSLYGIAFALAATSALARSQHSAARTRKSLSFGPDIPHASFTVAPQRYTSFTGGHSRSPYDVAREYVNNVLARGVPNGLQFIVRDDSYTDDATGVTHVYVRQLVNGLEVADGDINLNIFKGQVISLGDSFYRGPTPEFDGHPTSHSIDQHTEFCERLATRQRVAQSSQVVLDNQAQPYAWDEDHESLSTNYGINCNTHPLRQQSTTLAHPDIPEPDPRRAALLFMIAAHPDHGVAESLLSNLNAEVEKISVAYETHFVGEHAQPMAILSNVPGTVNPVKARLAYVQSPESEGSQKTVLHLVHKLEVEMKDNWYEAAVDAKNPTIIRSVVDWASDSPVPTHVESDSKPKGTYKVWKFGINDPSEGERSIEVGPYDKWASPLGWHSIPAAVDPSLKGHSGHLRDEIVNHTTTFGNNVFAHEDWEGANNWLNNYRPDGGENLEFVYKYFPKGDEPESDIKPKSYINLTVTQLFYTTNMVHDLYHRYGFDEKSGNFQQDNFGRGGRDGDAVIANAQDGSGYNNANFMTPPDGQNGRCRMYIWNTASPFRDGDLEAGIVIHELSHGLSTRLTGGPLNSGCLGWGESGGMGEGWGDFLATTIRSTKNYSDYAMGSWAANQEGGIRNFIYSTDLAVNPSTYKTLDKPGYWGVHAIGEVWAQILWVVSQKLIEKHGYSDTLFPPQRLENGTIPLGDFYREPTYEGAPLVPKHGNTLMVQLVINAMKLQPCRPSFFDARDAIIQADDILTGGENACELWSGFSSRGLGPDATLVGSTPWGGGIRKDGYAIPTDACKDGKTPDEEKTPKKGGKGKKGKKPKKVVA